MRQPRARGGPSLNDCLETGPNLIELIPSLLMRFREKRIGVTADIRKAFLQISISPEERDHLKFLWYRDGDLEKPIIYRHERVVFGVSSSPFLLGATINLLIDSAIEKAQFVGEKSILLKLKDSFYVDNCVTSTDSYEEAEEFQKVSTQVMETGGFDLRAWEYSSMKGANPESSVLGLRWHREEDTLSLVSPLLNKEKPSIITKRAILSIAQQLFDPLGMICPVVICPKILLQQVWAEGLDWDTEVGEDVREAFVLWMDQLSWVQGLTVPRWVFRVEGEDSEISLHAFVDASNVAYAAVIFARVQHRDRVEIKFVCAKSRISPKGTTIPRLELLSATVGARLMQSTLAAVPTSSCKLYYWTDSSTVLTWIQRNNQWATFVWNRVQEIRQLTDPADWSHVPGVSNPADLASRGCSAKQLALTKWHEGPEWLRQPPEQWPRTMDAVDENEVNLELKKTAKKSQPASTATTLVAGVRQATSSSEHGERPWYLRTCFSKYSQMIRLAAWMLRFRNNCEKSKEKKCNSSLTVQELEEAEHTIFKVMQLECFEGEKDPRLRDMLVYKDEGGLLRLKTPVAHRDDSMGFRCPVILDRQHILVSKLIEDCHLGLNHGPIDTTLNKLRERVWILSSRRAVQSVVRNCTRCKRYTSKRLESVPIPLPENRVRDASAFEVSGVDLAGPLFLKDGTKSWVVLLTCAVYRAVHLELVSSLSTDAFLEALRRFIARRGRPAIMYCDNGTNFTGASNVLGRLDWKQIEEHGLSSRIEWKFNPPSAAWWGGWWERIVRMVKDLLKRTLGKASLTYEELSTVLCDCEAVINARPLTYLAEDPQQLVALSPDMFLRDLPDYGVPDIDKVDSMSLNARVTYLQRLREELRSRFRIEYLGQLKQRGVTKSPLFTIQEGDIVFVGSDNKKRLDWPLARVVQCCPGKDGEVRVVRLKTADGYVVRPVQRLYPLELSRNETEKVLQTADDGSGEWRRASHARSPRAPRVSSSEHKKREKKTNGRLREEVASAEETSQVMTRRGRLVNKPKRLMD